MRSRHWGHIINIAWMHAGALRAAPNTLPYAISKGGIALLTKTLAKSEGEYGIRVNAVCPGFIATEGGHLPDNAVDHIPLARLGEPKEIASAVAFLASDRATYITGAILDVHGGALL